MSAKDVLPTNLGQIVVAVCSLAAAAILGFIGTDAADRFKERNIQAVESIDPIATENRLTRIESDVGYIKDSISEIKLILRPSSPAGEPK